MNIDEYGEVINGQSTYDRVARYLKEQGRILIGWTDENGTHFDILFTLETVFDGANFQGGIKPNDLFVSIMRWGAFAFRTDADRPPLHPSYVGEKLRVSGVTAEKMCELLKGILSSLQTP